MRLPKEKPVPEEKLVSPLQPGQAFCSSYSCLGVFVWVGTMVGWSTDAETGMAQGVTVTLEGCQWGAQAQADSVGCIRTLNDSKHLCLLGPLYYIMCYLKLSAFVKYTRVTQVHKYMAFI